MSALLRDLPGQRNYSMSHNAAFIASDLHSQSELDDVSEGSAWSHKSAPTATHYHMQSKLGVMPGGAWCLAR